MPVIVRPPPDEGVQLDYQVSRRGLLIGLDGCPYLLQERVNVLVGRLDQYAAFVTAYVLAEKIKTFLYVGYLGFLWGEFQTPFQRSHN